MSRTVFPPPPTGCHRTVLPQCGLPRTGHRGVAEPCDLFFALAPRSHDHQGDSRRGDDGLVGGCWGPGGWTPLPGGRGGVLVAVVAGASLRAVTFVPTNSRQGRGPTALKGDRVRDPKLSARARGPVPHRALEPLTHLAVTGHGIQGIAAMLSWPCIAGVRARRSCLYGGGTPPPPGGGGRRVPGLQYARRGADIPRSPTQLSPPPLR